MIRDNDVLITGINVITALGNDMTSTWQNLVAGKSGVGPITRFDASMCQTRIAAQVSDNFDEYARGFCKKRTAEQMTRVTRMAYVCALAAVDTAGIDFSVMNRRRCAVIMGAVSTGNSSAEQGTTSRNRIIKGMSNAIPAWISLHYRLEGPNFTVNTACASSAYAMALGAEYIRSGAADLVIAGGADSAVNREEIEGFNELFALSTANDDPSRASRPFTRSRDGFVIGEGAGVVILESGASVRARGARSLAQLAGHAVTSEAYNIMSPLKDGEGMAATMAAALQSAGIDPSLVDYINAHGTSTTLNDRYETMAIRRTFGGRASSIPVSSTKSMIGHTIAAAGAIEAAVTVMSINQGIVTPTINQDDPDPDCDLDYVPNISRPHEITVAITNSFAFGGHNAAIVLKKIDSSA